VRGWSWFLAEEKGRVKGRWCGTENGELRLELGERKKSFWMMGEGGSRLGVKEIELGFLFFFKIAPHLFFCVLKAIIYRQNIVWSPNFVPRVFVCKF
jgi:hypothetical protein